MWDLLLYVIACTAGYILYLLYEEDKSDKDIPTNKRNQKSGSQKRRIRYLKNKAKSIFNVIGIDLSSQEIKSSIEAISSSFSSLQEVSEACKAAGLASSNLILGVDFTASNEWQGKKKFKRNSLHEISGNKVFNPYQKVIWILGNTLRPFDEDNLIPAYGFGDVSTTDKTVFSFKSGGEPCHGFEEVMQCYNNIARRVTLSGPTNFAPVIYKAIDIVKETQSFHILVIIADGQVTEEDATITAIVEASNYPLSIIVVGVGDGPWDIMDEFDHRLPKRKFDNFHFVDYHQVVFRTKDQDAAFALNALMEIPDQYKKIKSLGYLRREGDPSSGSDDTGRLSDIDSKNNNKPTHRFQESKSSVRRKRFSFSKRESVGSYDNSSFVIGDIHVKQFYLEDSSSRSSSKSSLRSSTAV